MKKLVFTALAVVAFSGVAMAKTGEVKEEVVVSSEIKKVSEDFNACEERAINTYESIISSYEVLDDLALLNYLIGRCHPEYITGRG